MAFNQGAVLDLNGTIPLVASHGLGSTNANGCRAATSFDVPSGPPNTILGNPNFKLTLENATPLAPCVIVAGVPAFSPSIMVGDGLIPVDPNLGLTLFPPSPGLFFADVNGKLEIPSAIPAGGPFGLSITLFAVYTDTIVISTQISTGLTLNI